MTYSFRKNTIYALLGGVANGGIGIARGFLLAHLLGPARFGAWNAIQLMMAYGAFSGLGLTLSIPILMTQRLTQEDGPAQQRAGVTGFWAMFASAALTGLGLMLWAWLQPGSVVARYAFLIALAILSQQIFSAMITLLRGDLRFGQIAAGQVVMAVLSVLAVLWWVPRGGVAAAAWAIILSNALASAVCLWPMARWPWKAPDPRLAKQVLKESLPIMGSNICSTALQNVDRAVVGLTMGSLPLAYYGFASTFAAPLLLLPGILGGAVLTHFSRGTVAEEAEGQRVDLIRLTLGISGTMAALLAFLLAVATPVVEHLFPKYLSALPCLEILLVGSVFYGISSVLSTFMVVHNHRILLMKIQFLGLVLFSVLCYLAVCLGWGYLGVAWMNCVIYLLYYASLILATPSIRAQGRRLWLTLLTAGLAPVAYVEMVHLAYRHLLKPIALAARPEPVRLAFQAGVYLAALLPLGWLLFKWYRRAGRPRRAPETGGLA